MFRKFWIEYKTSFRKSSLYGPYHRLRNRLNHTVDNVTLAILWVASRNTFLSNVYYVFNGDFSREHRSVLLGRVKYYSDRRGLRASQSMLRRNIHRLEKGMIMRPRRPLFAVDYIEQTVDAYEKRINSANGDFNSEIVWAFHVLQEYFHICGEAPAVRRVRDRFGALTPPIPSQIVDAPLLRKPLPYSSASRPPLDITYEEFLQLARRRRSVRWFRQTPVEVEKIDKLLQLARLAPTACNRMPFNFLVIEKPEQIAKVAGFAGGTGGFGHQIPLLLVVTGDLSDYAHEKDRHLIYIDASLAAMSLMFGAETLGLSSCAINWSDVGERERSIYGELDFLPLYVRPIMLIAVGYPDDEGLIPFSSKKEIKYLKQVPER